MIDTVAEVNLERGNLKYTPDDMYSAAYMYIPETGRLKNIPEDGYLKNRHKNPGQFSPGGGCKVKVKLSPGQLNVCVGGRLVVPAQGCSGGGGGQKCRSGV